MELAAVDAKLNAIPPLPVVWVGNHRDAAGPFPVFIGGDPQKKGNMFTVRASVLASIHRNFELPDTSNEGVRRHELAKWIASETNPLTTRS